MAGNCHVYIDPRGRRRDGSAAGAQRQVPTYGVCNAAESLVVHADAVETHLPMIGKALIEAGIEIRGDEQTCRLLPQAVRRPMMIMAGSISAR